MKKKTKSGKRVVKNKSDKSSILVGVALAGALAGYFLYGSKDASKNRQKIRGWMLKAKGEVLEKVEKLKNVTEAEYNAAVDSVLKKYSTIKSIDEKEVKSLGENLKKHWRSFTKEVKKVSKE